MLFLVENPCCPGNLVLLCVLFMDQSCCRDPGRDTKVCLCTCVCKHARVCDFWHEMKSEVYCIPRMHFIWLFELYIDTNKTVLCVVSSRHPQSVFSAEPLHGAHRSWGRGRAWLTGQSKHRYAAWGEETCHRFPNEESKAMWVGRYMLQLLKVQVQPLFLSVVPSSGW